MQSPETKMGLGRVAASKPQCIAVQANAEPGYSQTERDGNTIRPGTERTGSTPAARQSQSGLECPVSPSQSNLRYNLAQTAYRDSEGRIWRYRGKRARVLDMLVASPGGITQWDTLPWHTRLGGSIHAMREDGLPITTELEGPYRHARYRLAIALVGETIPGEHRDGG